MTVNHLIVIVIDQSLKTNHNIVHSLIEIHLLYISRLTQFSLLLCIYAKTEKLSFNNKYIKC